MTQSIPSDRGRRGQTMLEFTLVGIPLMFVLISIFEISRGMWTYHTMAFAVKDGVRFASVHGINCINTTGSGGSDPNNCATTIAVIAQKIRDAGVIFDPTQTALTFFPGDGGAASTTCKMVGGGGTDCPQYNEDTSRSPNPAPTCAVCTKDKGAVVGCADQAAGQCLASQTTQEIVNENHVTANSPGITIEPGNPKLHLRGVLYQPRGAWMTDQHGVGFDTGDLEIVTGSFELTTGTDKLLLRGPTNPLITYKTALIQ
jgi:hypothetical protein